MNAAEDLIVNVLAHAQMAWTKNVTLKSFLMRARTPDKTQQEVLLQILNKNKDTEFGQHHNFSAIGDIKRYIQHMPLHNYEDLRSYFEKQMTTGERAILPEKSDYYARTSGTTGRPKYIPIPECVIKSHKRALRLSTYVQYRDVPGIFSGKILAVAGAAFEGRLADGTPYGSVSGLIYEGMPSIVLTKYVLPSVISEIEDYESKYRLIAAFGLRCANITCLAAANPSTLLRVADVISLQYPVLVDFIECGDIEKLKIVASSEQIDKLATCVYPDPKRADFLKTIPRDNISFSTIWPNVKGVVTWTGGNCKLLIPKLEKLLPPQTKIIEAGYLSTEFRGTITIDCNRNLGLPTLDDNFYEFAPVETWDRGDRHTLLLSQLEKGKRYYIIVTTPNGLYRYFIDDIVEVTGHFESTPTLSFVQKAKGITSLTGEKLYENQVIEAMAYTARLHGLDATFFMMLANREHFSYVLYIECDNKFETKMVSDTFNACLSRLNLEYSSKVDSGRLKPAHVRKLKNKTADAYKAFCLNSGQREAQFKFVHLQYHNDTSFTFEKYTET